MGNATYRHPAAANVANMVQQPVDWNHAAYMTQANNGGHHRAQSGMTRAANAVQQPIDMNHAAYMAQANNGGHHRASSRRARAANAVQQPVHTNNAAAYMAQANDGGHHRASSRRSRAANTVQQPVHTNHAAAYTAQVNNGHQVAGGAHVANAVQPFDWNHAANAVQPFDWNHAANAVQPFDWNHAAKAVQPFDWNHAANAVQPFDWNRAANTAQTGTRHHRASGRDRRSSNRSQVEKKNRENVGHHVKGREQKVGNDQAAAVTAQAIERSDVPNGVPATNRYEIVDWKHAGGLGDQAYEKYLATTGSNLVDKIQYVNGVLYINGIQYINGVQYVRSKFVNTSPAVVPEVQAAADDKQAVAPVAQAADAGQVAVNPKRGDASTRPIYRRPAPPVPAIAPVTRPSPAVIPATRQSPATSQATSQSPAATSWSSSATSRTTKRSSGSSGESRKSPATTPRPTKGIGSAVSRMLATVGKAFTSSQPLPKTVPSTGTASTSTGMTSGSTGTTSPSPRTMSPQPDLRDPLVETMMYPHTASHQTLIDRLMCPGGGFAAVKLCLVAGPGAGHRVNNGQWCSVNCLPPAAAPHDIKYVVRQSKSLVAFRHWFSTQRCDTCQKYLALGIQPQIVDKMGDPSPDIDWPIPKAYPELWTEEFMSQVVHD